MFHKYSKSPAERFWKWFLKKKGLIEQFIDAKERNYTIYNQLTRKIKRYNPYVIPELTKSDNNYVMILSADGNPLGLEPIKKLHQSHPKIDNWEVNKFRQPSDKINLNFNGIEFPSEDIEIIPIFDIEEKVDLRIFVRNLNKNEKGYKSLTFLYLDHILGEFNSITKVRFVDFYHLEENESVEDGISLLELRKLIEKNLY